LAGFAVNGNRKGQYFLLWNNELFYFAVHGFGATGNKGEQSQSGRSAEKQAAAEALFQWHNWFIALNISIYCIRTSGPAVIKWQRFCINTQSLPVPAANVFTIRYLAGTAYRKTI
jgi:hypothetical protein